MKKTREGVRILSWKTKTKENDQTENSPIRPPGLVTWIYPSPLKMKGLLPTRKSRVFFPSPGRLNFSRLSITTDDFCFFFTLFPFYIFLVFQFSLYRKKSTIILFGYLICNVFIYTVLFWVIWFQLRNRCIWWLFHSQP